MTPTPTTETPLSHGQRRILDNLRCGAPLLEGVRGRDCGGSLQRAVSQLIGRGLVTQRGGGWRLTDAGKALVTTAPVSAPSAPPAPPDDDAGGDGPAPINPTRIPASDPTPTLFNGLASKGGPQT